MMDSSIISSAAGASSAKFYTDESNLFAMVFPATAALPSLTAMAFTLASKLVHCFTVSYYPKLYADELNLLKPLVVPAILA